MSVGTGVEKLQDFVDGKWQAPLTTEFAPVHNPATGQVIAEVPMGTAADVDRAVQAAHAAFPTWREVPPVQRARYLFELKFLLEMTPEQWRGALGDYVDGPRWRTNGYIVAITRRQSGDYTTEFQDRWAPFVRPADATDEPAKS